jgi:hypothetical protein
MTGPFGALDQSLRGGPPDENGYRPRPLDLPTGSSEDSSTRAVALEHVVPLRAAQRPRTALSRPFLATAIVVVIGLTAFGIVGVAGRPVLGPASSPTQSSSPASPSPSSPSPTLHATPRSSGSAIVVPPLTATFASSRNGFSVLYPAGWTVTRATTGWPQDTFLVKGHPAFDELDGPGLASFVVASQPLGTGQTEDDWLTAFFRPYPRPDGCDRGDRTTWRRLPIDGTYGYLDVDGCPNGVDARLAGQTFDMLAFAGGRVYQIALDGDVDIGYFEAMIASVHLDPTKALD